MEKTQFSVHSILESLTGLRFTTGRLFAIGALVGVIVLGTTFRPFAIVPAGHRGVVFNEFEGVKVERNLTEGFHFVSPYVEHVINLSVRVEKASFKASASSKDLQQVNTEIAINYHLDPDNAARVYQQIGEEYVTKLIEPSVQESIKAVTAEYNATDLIAKRPLVKQKAQEMVTQRLGAFHILVDDFSITDFKFSPEFEAAIEAKQVAEQEALQKNYELQKAHKDAEIAVTRAEGEKKATIARAQAKSEEQRLLQMTVTERVLELKRIEKWDGTMPKVVGSSVPMEMSLDKLAGM
jgi:regulator of protease activity HflC (stomatin/prohibitin superfamily)